MLFPVTSGALTFLLLAASLVTLSFLMSPVIERVFGKEDGVLVTSVGGVAASLVRKAASLYPRPDVRG